MKNNSLHFDLLGTSFTIAADEDGLYLENLLNRYRIILENTRKSTGINDPLKLAILTGFLLCDELERKTSQESREGKELEQRALNMIARIDEIIPNPPESYNDGTV